MAFDDYRQRNYMTPNFGGGWATPSFENKPFTGMQIQGPLPYQQAPQIQMPGQQSEDKDFDMFENMFNAPTPALEAYKRHIMTSPKRENYRASKMDRVGAAFAGVSEALHKGGGAGYQAAKAVVDNPYLQAIQDYQVQGQGLGELANIESADTKSKMGYAKTMMDAKREALKTAADIARLEKQNEVSDVNMQEARTRMQTAGLDLERSAADGILYVIDKAKGTRTPVGKFEQTPEEKSALKVKEQGAIDTRQGAITLGNQQNMAGVNFGYDVNLEGIRSGNRTGEHATNRAFDAANPIPTSGFDFTAPSQHKIAFDTAMSEVITNNPASRKFFGADGALDPRAVEADRDGYAKFLTAVQTQRDKIISEGKRRPVSVNLPAPAKQAAPVVVQNPLNTPTPETPARKAAIEQLKTDGKPVNDETIQWMMRKLAQ